MDVRKAQPGLDEEGGSGDQQAQGGEEPDHETRRTRRSSPSSAQIARSTKMKDSPHSVKQTSTAHQDPQNLPSGNWIPDDRQDGGHAGNRKGEAKDGPASCSGLLWGDAARRHIPARLQDTVTAISPMRTVPSPPESVVPSNGAPNTLGIDANTTQQRPRPHPQFNRISPKLTAPHRDQVDTEEARSCRISPLRPPWLGGGAAHGEQRDLQGARCSVGRPVRGGGQGHSERLAAVRAMRRLG